jgi:hypothetical protein
METEQTIADLYGEHTQGAEPAGEHVAQLLALLEPGEMVLFTCGWTEMSEKWGPPAQLSVTSRRIVDQRWAGVDGGPLPPPRQIALADVRAVLDRPRGEAALFSTHALVVALRDGTNRVWEHLTNHQIEPAAAAIEAALQDAG